jgi:hypothetical protein
MAHAVAVGIGGAGVRAVGLRLGEIRQAIVIGIGAGNGGRGGGGGLSGRVGTRGADGAATGGFGGICCGEETGAPGTGGQGGWSDAVFDWKPADGSLPALSDTRLASGQPGEGGALDGARGESGGTNF